MHADWHYLRAESGSTYFVKFSLLTHAKEQNLYSMTSALVEKLAKRLGEVASFWTSALVIEKVVKVPMQRKFCFSYFIFIWKFFENDVILFTVSRHYYSLSRYCGLFDIQITHLMTSNCIMLAVKFEITFNFQSNVCQELSIHDILRDT